MTNVVGIMCVRDEADLLPEVLEHLDGEVDQIYAYDDGSKDGTFEILKSHALKVGYIKRRKHDTERLDIPRPNYHHLLERIKQDYEGEEVWAVITMGDRFFLNKTPRQIVAEAGEFTAVEGIQLDFLRPRTDPWTEENDTWPVYSNSLRKLCRWVRIDERCIVAYKVTNAPSYRRSAYPWPKAVGPVQYECAAMNEQVSLDMPFLEHQGRRSPKALMERISQGCRVLGRKYKDYDLSTFESTVECNHVMYKPISLFPWIGLESLDPIVKWHNQKSSHYITSRRWFFKGVEAALENIPLPERTDI